MKTAITYIGIIGLQSLVQPYNSEKSKKYLKRIQGRGVGEKAVIKPLKFSKFINAIKLYYKIPQINVHLMIGLNEAGVLRTICIIMTKIKVLWKQNGLI